MPTLHSPRCRSASFNRGFTLIEMLVAVFFLSLLMAGMFRIYAAATKSFTVTRESITAQRASRWALDFLNEDIRQVGLFYPPRPVPSYITVANGAQNPVMVLPGQTMTCNATQPDGTTQTETITFDEFQGLTDEVLPISATLGANIAAGISTMSFNVLSGSMDDVKQDDVIIFMDQNSTDVLRVGTVSGNSVTLTATPAGGLIDVSLDDGIPRNAATQNPHLVNTPVMFIRPNRVIRYSIQADALDPANSSNQVPVLVREMAPYPTNGALLNWSAFATTPPPNYTRERIAVNVSGLRIDMSGNAGQAWARSAAASNGTAGWGQMAAQVNTQLPAGQSITDPTNPLWCRTIPMLFRFDLQTRSSNLRAESSAGGGTLAYKTRTQTFFVAPRNFTLGQ